MVLPSPAYDQLETTETISWASVRTFTGCRDEAQMWVVVPAGLWIELDDGQQQGSGTWTKSRRKGDFVAKVVRLDQDRVRLLGSAAATAPVAQLDRAGLS